MLSFHRSRAKPPNAERSYPDEGGSNSLVASAWLIVALEEYKALRAEIVDSIQAQRTVMQLGFTGVSLLIGLGLQRTPSLLASIILVMLVPSVAFFITTAAWGELLRAARASSFLAERESAINEVAKGAGPPAMAWENWLRRRPISVVSTDGQFLALYALTIGGAIVGSVTMFTAEVRRDQPVLVLIGVVATTVLICAGNLVRYKQLRRKTEREFRGATP